VRLAKVALTGRVVAEEAGKLRRDLVDDGRSAARLRLVDQRGRVCEGSLDLSRVTRILGAEEGSGARQERVHLEEAVAALRRVGQGLIRQLQGDPRIALTEPRLCQEARRPHCGSEADAAPGQPPARSTRGHCTASTTCSPRVNERP